MTAVSLFSGVLGLDLACEVAGFETVCYVEWDKDCQRVIRERRPVVPVFGDVREFTLDAFRDATGLGTCDIVVGGPPCQPFSSAGKRQGADDSRDMWPEFVRVVAELRPRWFLAENVEGLVQRPGAPWHSRYVAGLALLGYRVGWGVLGADEACGCPMQGDRLFTVGKRLAQADGGARGDTTRASAASTPRTGHLGSFGALAPPTKQGLYGSKKPGEHGGSATPRPSTDGPQRQCGDLGSPGPCAGRPEQWFQLHPGSWAREPSGMLFPPPREGGEADWSRVGAFDFTLWPALTREEEAQLPLRRVADGVPRRMDGLALADQGEEVEDAR